MTVKTGGEPCWLSSMLEREVLEEPLDMGDKLAGEEEEGWLAFSADLASSAADMELKNL